VFDKVLNVFPNINSLSVFTAVMVPSNGLFLAELAKNTFYVASDIVAPYF
jgi:hypothetical protein